MSSAGPPLDPRDSPERLAAAAMAGDAAAFHLLQNALNSGVLRYFLARRPRDRDSCEELAHAAWIECWKSLQMRRFDSRRASFATYLYSICRHVWLQALRDRNKPFPEPRPEPVSAAPDEVLSRAELLDALRGCIETAGLTADERTVIGAVLQAQTERQLARTLGLAASTVHQRKADAFAKLRACLGKKGFPAEVVEQMARERESIM